MPTERGRSQKRERDEAEDERLERHQALQGGNKRKDIVMEDVRSSNKTTFEIKQ